MAFSLDLSFNNKEDVNVASYSIKGNILDICNSRYQLLRGKGYERA